MGRKSNEPRDIDSNAEQKKRKRKGKESQINPQEESATSKKKRKASSVSITPLAQTQAGVSNSSNVADSTVTGKKKRKDAKSKQRLVQDEPLVDPALSMQINNEGSSNAFVSAILTAAAQQGQVQNQSENNPNLQGTNFGPNFQLPGQDPSSGLDGLDATSNEDLVRAIQVLDVKKLADALRALGDAGSANHFLDPTQLAQVQANVNSITFAQASQVPPPSAMILAHPPVVLPPVGPNTFVPSVSDEHARMLATKWLSTSKLAQLTKTIGLTYKKGKFSTTEENSVKEGIEFYRRRNGLSEEQINEIIFAKSKVKDNSFWFELTSRVPNRPVIAVYHYVRRAYHPMKAQGKWMPSEDELLRKAVIELGQSWEKVSQRVGRMASDCRDRWRNHINHSEGRVFGIWTFEEERRLTEIVTEMTTAQGKSSDHDVFWTQVAARMGTRGRHQCRIKWTDSLNKTVKNEGQTPRWSPQDAYILVHKIAALNVRDDSEIDWKLLPDENWNLWSTHALQRRWLTLKRSVKGYEEMSHQEIMDILRVKKAQLPPVPQPVRSRVVSAPIVPMDAQAADVAISDSLNSAAAAVTNSNGFTNMGINTLNNAPTPGPSSSVYFENNNSVALPATTEKVHEEANDVDADVENGDDSDKDDDEVDDDDEEEEVGEEPKAINGDSSMEAEAPTHIVGSSSEDSSESDSESDDSE